jgi:hypothetical protein
VLVGGSYCIPKKKFEISKHYFRHRTSAIFAHMDLLEILSAEQWETTRNWLGTAGGLIALLFAARTYVRDVKNKREEQARLVYSSLNRTFTYAPDEVYSQRTNGAQANDNSSGIHEFDHWDPEDPKHAYVRATQPLLEFVTVIHNKSEELIGPVRIQIISRLDSHPLPGFSASIDVIEPDTDFVIGLTRGTESADVLPVCVGTMIDFRDGSGQWWHRRLGDPIAPLRSDPTVI